MGIVDTLVKIIPEVSKPTRKLGFGEKAKWTLIVLVAYFTLGVIPLFGVNSTSFEQFSSLSILLGAQIGTLITLGIGPIVTASIILQLLNGSGIMKFDLASHEGKAQFQATQKLLAYGLIIFESFIYVLLGGLNDGTTGLSAMNLLIIGQMILGGFMIMMMDEVTHKWGFGSGVSLFIAAGVSQALIIRLFSWFRTSDTGYSVGAIFTLFQAFGAGDMQTVWLSLSGILFTLVILGLSIYFQSMKVEIPLSFGRVRGHGIRWPLNFLYTSNIPVILIAALLANIQIGAVFLSRLFPSIDPNSVQPWVLGPRIVPDMIQTQTFWLGWTVVGQALVYLLIFMVGSVIFSWFWVQTSGMDARTQSKNIIRSGLQIPGFRKDPRIVEKVLERYINPLTIMGAIAVAILATGADMLGALSSGTGLLLAVMIIYRMYEDIAKQHMADMNPMLRSFMGGE